MIDTSVQGVPVRVMRPDGSFMVGISMGPDREGKLLVVYREGNSACQWTHVDPKTNGITAYPDGVTLLLAAIDGVQLLRHEQDTLVNLLESASATEGPIYDLKLTLDQHRKDQADVVRYLAQEKLAKPLFADSFGIKYQGRNVIVSNQADPHLILDDPRISEVVEAVVMVAEGLSIPPQT